ncbi:MAG: hypothetical protein CSB33_03445, partial [Desulfobacterales bacterium]
MLLGALPGLQFFVRLVVPIVGVFAGIAPLLQMMRIKALASAIRSRLFFIQGGAFNDGGKFIPCVPALW